MIMMRAVIDNNRRLNRKTYCYFADTCTCFDKLWLKESWNEGEGGLHVILNYTESHIVIENIYC